jgi:hypothetical protein
MVNDPSYSGGLGSNLDQGYGYLTEVYRGYILNYRRQTLGYT